MHNNNIIIDLRVSKDNVGEIILIVGIGGIGGIGGAVPSIDARSVETQVLIADGQTVVLSGIYEAERRETTKKTPFLGDLPVLGNLFRNKECTESKVELLIFVTPRILKEGSSIY
jgi:type IV pilus assembly protein PilQ